jgi:hypothetical protein
VGKARVKERQTNKQTCYIASSAIKTTQKLKEKKKKAEAEVVVRRRERSSLRVMMTGDNKKAKADSSPD